MEFILLTKEQDDEIENMSAMACEIVREHFDPIIGKAQNDYMLEKFQTVSSIREQLERGYQYYFVRENGQNLGFLAFFPRNGAMYLSKFYLYKGARGKGISLKMLDFVIENARVAGIDTIELNVNRGNPVCRIYESMGFEIARLEKNDIGSGFFMDDYVYSLDIPQYVQKLRNIDE